MEFNSLMHNVLKWSDTLRKSWGICSIFKWCLTIFGHYVLQGLKEPCVSFEQFIFLYHARQIIYMDVKSSS